jgi:nucleotide-binding universal stress UspA family protein
MMRHIPPPSPSVVVGIDGSRSAITAALWAVDEARLGAAPLRMLPTTTHGTALNYLARHAESICEPRATS